jgi:hypothetical protein
MKFYVLRLVDWLPNAVRQQTSQSIAPKFAEQLSGAMSTHVRKL